MLSAAPAAAEDAVPKAPAAGPAESVHVYH
jgi:hypothetical protein